MVLTLLDTKRNRFDQANIGQPDERLRRKCN